MAPLIPPALEHSSLPRSLDSTSSTQNIPRDNYLDTSLPTRTLTPRTLSSLLRRQQVTVTASPSSTSTSNPKPIIPANYSGLNTGPPPGEVVGIVFGSVAGFLLLLWLIYTCISLTGWAPSSSVIDEEVVVRRRRSHSPRRHSVSSRSRSETIEVTRQRSVSRSRSRSRSPVRRESSRRETVIIEETRRPSRAPPPDDIVEVIEDHSPPPSKSRRSSGRQSGFRTIDPDAFGGGNRPMRKVSRHD